MKTRILIFAAALSAGTAFARAADEWRIDATVFEADQKLPDAARDAVTAVMDAKGSASREELQAALRALREARRVDVVTLPSATVKIGQTGSLVIYPVGAPPGHPMAKRPVLELSVKPTPEGGHVKLAGRLVFTRWQNGGQDGKTLVARTFEAPFTRLADPGGTVGIWGWTRSQTMEFRDSDADGSNPVDSEETRQLRAGFFVTVKPTGTSEPSEKDRSTPPAAK